MRISNIDDYKLSLREVKNGSLEVLDVIRRKWVAFTPEEKVRQYILRILVNKLGYPEGLIVVEHSFSFTNGKPQRADILVYDRKGQPYLLVECKAPQIKITDSVFSQISRYNSTLRARNLIITNGNDHYSLSTEDFMSYKHELNFPPAP